MKMRMLYGLCNFYLLSGLSFIHMVIKLDTILCHKAGVAADVKNTSTFMR